MVSRESQHARADPKRISTPPTLSGVLLAFSDIKLAHSVFALPFAVLGAFLATPAFRAGAAPGQASRFAGQLALVVLCKVAARTWAMLVNRIADRGFDAANPRTARRAVASGRLPVRDAWLVALAAAAMFLAACALFWVFFQNPWPLALGAPTLGWVALYSYTKRFTALCHIVLGSALAFSPIAAAIAVNPSSLAATPALWLLAAMVVCWVAGFDILYATQDIDFDRKTGLKSIPAALGHRRAAWASRLLHAAAFAFLALAWWADPRFSAIFAAATLGVAVLLIAEHAYLARTGIAGLPISFGLINGMVSIAVGTLGVVDILR